MEEQVEDTTEVKVDLVDNDTEKEDATLIPEERKQKLFFTQPGSWQLLIGLAFIPSYLIIGFMGSGILCAILISWTGFYFILLGFLNRFPPPEKFQLNVTVNGRQCCKEILLKRIICCSINITFGLTGIIISIFVGNSTTWLILGITLSILFIIVTTFGNNLRAICQSNLEIFQASSVHYTIISFGMKFKAFKENSNKVMLEPISISQKPVHLYCLILAMLNCGAMFAIQIADVLITDPGQHQIVGYFQDPSNFFAKNYISGPFGTFSSRDRVQFILFSSVLTFLLSITLIVLLLKTTVIRIFLYSVIAFGIGTFFTLLSSYSISYIILMGSNLPFLTCVLKMTMFMSIPILASLFMALSYSSCIQLFCNQKTSASTEYKKRVINISIILAIIIIFFSIVGMISSSLWMTSAIQKWSSIDSNHKHEPDFELWVNHFSISQLSHFASLLFLSFYVILTGKRITKSSLFMPGLALFVSTLLTSTLGVLLFSNVSTIDFSLRYIGVPFFIINGLSNGTAFITGITFLFIGNEALISFMQIILKAIISVTAFVLSFLFMEISKAVAVDTNNQEKLVI